MTEEHVHEWPRLWAKLTPSGIRIDLIACFARMIDLLGEDQAEQALEYAKTFRELFAATAMGRFDLIEQGYETAVITSFEQQLGSDEELTKLLEEGK